MNKVVGVVLTAVLVLSPILVFAHGKKDKAEGGCCMMGDKGKKGDQDMMCDKGMMGMMGMRAMMNKPMLVATSDGGVVVLAGKKLYKYDASLNLVKEADIKCRKWA